MDFYEEDKSLLRRIMNWMVDIILVIVFAWFTVYMFGTEVRIAGNSMNPALESGDVVLMNRLPGVLFGPGRFDLAVFEREDQKTNVKRVIGLPGETDAQMVQTARYIGQSGTQGIKLHLLHVLRGTDLAADYAAGKFEVLTPEHYIDLLEQCLCVLPPEVVIHRLTGDGAKRDLIAPLWSADKKRVLNAIHAAFARDDLVQGSEL